MKYEFENLKDLTYSKEILKSKPTGFSMYITYIIIVLLLIVLGWSIFAKKIISINVPGIIMINNDVSNISSNINGEINTINIKDGDIVKKGDMILTINNEDYYLEKDKIDRNFISKTEELNKLKKLRDSVLEDTNKFDISNSEELSYYKKYELYEKNKNSNLVSKDERDIILNEINYNNLLIKSIQENNNYLNDESSYDYLYKNYEISINDYNNIIQTSKDKIKKLEYNSNNSNKEKVLSEIEDLRNNIRNTETQIKKFKNDTISNASKTIEENKLKLTQLDKHMENYLYKEEYIQNLDEIIKNMESNISDINDEKKIIDSKIDKTFVKASYDGIISLANNFKVGDYIMQGSEIASIIPEEISSYKVETHINNEQIGNINEGQDVLIEIKSLPAAEYGYIKSELDNISVDVKADNVTGIKFYTAICNLNVDGVMNKKEEVTNIKNGMEVDVRIITRETTYFKYFLERLNITI